MKHITTTFGAFGTKAFSIALMLGASLSGAQAADNSVDNAFALCHVIDNTGMASEPCEVSGWGSEVIATIDMNSAEARELCPQVAGLMREKGRTFAAGWTFHIRSPYSNGNSIAFCRL